MFVRGLFWFVRGMEELPVVRGTSSLPNLTIHNGSSEASEVWVVRAHLPTVVRLSHCTSSRVLRFPSLQHRQLFMGEK